MEIEAVVVYAWRWRQRLQLHVNALNQVVLNVFLSVRRLGAKGRPSRRPSMPGIEGKKEGKSKLFFPTILTALIIYCLHHNGIWFLFISMHCTNLKKKIVVATGEDK